MKRVILAAGVAALAISAPAASKPGEKHGGGHDRPNAAKVHKGGGGKAAHNRGPDRKAAKHSNASDKRVKQAAKAHKQRAESRQKMAEQRSKARHKAVQQARKADNKRFEAQQKLAERRRDARSDRIERLRERRDDLRLARIDRDDRIGYGVGGCPPGLMSKGCMPPGQAKKLVGEPLRVVKQRVAFRDLPDRLRNVYRDTPNYYYRYGDGYVYRVNRQNDIVSALLPMFGLGLTAGQAFPTAYSSYAMPASLQPFYPSVPQYDYRYANGYVYQVDPRTGLIRDVDPLLGYGYGYGQMLPAAYSAYNVPYQYRPIYQDTSDYYYRYAPGTIYQVDPQTSLITGIAALLGNGMTVGQPIPVGYGVYNVPYGYRTQYYDTPDAWYRYSAGNIYRIDPATQLVTALVASILT